MRLSELPRSQTMVIKVPWFTLCLALAVAGGISCKRRDQQPAVGEQHAQEHASELPSASVTVWSEKSELFMEYTALVAGHEANLAVHVTVLAGWKPLTTGAVRLTLTMADGRTTVAEASSTSRPGIFRPALKPPSAGKCKLAIHIGGDHNDDLDAGPCEVFSNAKAAHAATSEKAGGGTIAFSKEQQWATHFESVGVSERELQPTVRVNGEIKSVAGKEARLAAPAPGRVQLANPAPIIGSTVHKGQLLASIFPRLANGADRATLEADVQAAGAELIAAEAQLARALRLFADQSVPQRSVDDARAAAEVARARASAARGRRAQQSATASGVATAGQQGAFQIRAPWRGTLAMAQAATGETVDEGQMLFLLVDLAKVWLQGRVFEPDIPKVETSESGWFWVEGYEAPFAFNPTNARRITLGRVLDPQTRTVPLIFELDNADAKLRVGQFAKMDVAAGPPALAIALPVNALVEEGDKSVAYVQVSGEAFERRALSLGARSAGWVAVRDGLRVGERVVVKGAYDVKLAASAGATPAHGHAH